MERLLRLRLVLESALRLRRVGFCVGLHIGFHGRAIGRRRHASVAVAPVASATAAAAPPAPPLAATAARLLATLTMHLAMRGLGACLQGFLFLLALVVPFLLVDCFLEGLLLVLLGDRDDGRGLGRNRFRLLDAVDLLAF